MKKILITGVSGAIGTALVELVLEKGYEVTGYDLQEVEEKSKGYQHIQGDITDKKKLSREIKKADIVVHLAAILPTKVAKNKENRKRLYEVNQKTTEDIAFNCSKMSKRLLFASSVSVYGENAIGRITESCMIHPDTDYAKSKANAEKEVLNAGGTVLRFPMVYGKRDHGNMFRMIRAINSGFFFIPGSGIEPKGFISSRNAAEAILSSIKEPSSSGQIYLATDGEEYCLNDIAIKISDLLEVDRPKVVPSKIMEIIAALGTKIEKCTGMNVPFNMDAYKKLTKHLVFDDSKIRKQLGYDSKHTVIESISEQIFWYKTMPCFSFDPLRKYDIALSLLGIVHGTPVFIIIYLIGKLDTGAPIFVQERVGRNKKTFKLYKFRTMYKDTMHIASHLANKKSITRFGHYLRRTKLDELPQLINIIRGEMSFVGPRPNLLNQKELIEERSKRGVYDVLPGITGLAQITGIDMSTPELLASTDYEMILNMSRKKYFEYIFRTLLGSGRGDAIKKEEEFGQELWNENYSRTNI